VSVAVEIRLDAEHRTLAGEDDVVPVGEERVDERLVELGGMRRGDVGPTTAVLETAYTSASIASPPVSRVRLVPTAGAVPLGGGSDVGVILLQSALDNAHPSSRWAGVSPSIGSKASE
jgi:hypothetical protein